MKKSVWPVIALFILFSLILFLGGCFKISVPQNTGQNPSAPFTPTYYPDDHGKTSAKPDIVSFTANPGDIGARGASKLIWNVIGATAVSIDQGIGMVDPVGSVNVYPSQTTLYTLTALNESGGKTATTLVTVTTTTSPATMPPAFAGLPYIQVFAANPATINAGDTAMLNWIVANASQVTISLQGARQMSAVPPAGNRPVTPSETTVYILTATNSSGTTENAVTVTVTGQLAATTTQYYDWAGTWDTNWGAMTLSQLLGKVTGTYSHDTGKITGNISKVISGNMLIGTWSEAPSYAPPQDAGDFEWTAAPDFMSFTGKWRYGSTSSWSGDWHGIRVK